MKTGKAAALLVAFLLLATPMLVAVPLFAQHTPGAPVYYSVELVAVPPLTDTNSSLNGLETPTTPSPVGQYFYVEIHLRDANTTNVPAGVAGAEVHLNFSSVLPYAQVINFTDMLGLTGGVLTGPHSSLISAIPAGFYDNSDNPVSAPPYTRATRYEVASASTASTAWNAPDGLVAVILFKITDQPTQQDFLASMNIIFAGLTDGNFDTVPYDVFPGTLHIDASAAQGQQYALAVNVVGNGTVTQNPLNATYLNGTVVTLTAVPAINWTFQSWSGDLTGSQNPTTITMNANKTVTATFTQVSAVNYTLTVNVVGNGTVSESPAATTYPSGTVVTLTALPSDNSTFQGWSGDVIGIQNPTTITMNANKTVTAIFSSIAFGGSVDLFTQKSPFNGKGPNQPSDAFQQQELVILYALVTFGGVPIANKIVGFQVNGPPNSLQNITVTGSAATNSSGIAEFSFRIPTAPINEDQTVFGEWFAIATVDVDQVTLTDTLTFQVGWIISIKSIATLNAQLVAQTSFFRQNTIVFNLTLENIAFTPKNATITIDVQDTGGNPIIHIELDNIIVQPGESYIQASSQIPLNSKIGVANASATAYTAPPANGGIPWSPSVYTTFNIIITPVSYTLTVNVSGNGTVTESPFSATYPSGTVVTLTAVPTANWTFQSWSGDITGAQNPTTITMDTDKTVTATFTQVSAVNYTLTVNVVGNGTVTQSPPATTYPSGSVVTLTAVPAINWTFQSWSGDLTGTQNPATITINANKTVTATFTQQVSVVNYTLTVNVVGSGYVTESPFSATYPSGTVVTLTAVPTANSFQSWSGDITGTQNPTTITMNANKTVTATFTQFAQYYTLTVKTVGSGTVTESPAAATYLSGTVVTLTAVPPTGWTFQAWSGDITSTQNPTTITMDTDKTVTATFTQVSAVNYTLTVNVVGNGTVTQSPLSATYLNGTVVTLTAVPPTGWTFQAWGGDITSTQNPATIMMNANKIVTATFTQVSAVNYTLTVNVVGNGTVTENPAAATYSSGTVVTLTAVPVSGWTFQVWSGDVTGSQNPTTITMNANKIVTATFTQVSPANYTLTVNVVGSGTVTQSPAGFTYLSGTVVTLTVVLTTGWTFQSWSGDLTGTQNPTTITMNANKIVTATFTQVSAVNYTLTVNVVGNGTVTQSPLSATYLNGTVVTLTAVPTTGWTFQSWSGDLTGTQNPTTITMNANKIVTATFVQGPPPVKEHDVAVLAVSVSPSQVGLGETVQITVEAANLGDYTETFNVTVTYDSNTVEVLTVVSLAPHSPKTLTVEWNTGSANPGVYTISASATVVEGDVNPENNHFIDGNVTVTSITPAQFMSYPAFLMIFIGLAILGGLASTMFFLIYYGYDRRRRKKARTTPRYAVIVHPHI